MRVGSDVMTIELEDLRGLFAYVLEDVDLDADANFFASGGDSLLAVRLITKIVHNYGVDLTFADFSQAPTPRSLLRMLKGVVPGETT
jgi:acyl carrier protein